MSGALNPTEYGLKLSKAGKYFYMDLKAKTQNQPKPRIEDYFSVIDSALGLAWAKKLRKELSRNEYGLFDIASNKQLMFYLLGQWLALQKVNLGLKDMLGFGGLYLGEKFIRLPSGNPESLDIEMEEFVANLGGDTELSNVLSSEPEFGAHCKTLQEELMIFSNKNSTAVVKVNGIMHPKIRDLELPQYAVFIRPGSSIKKNTEGFHGILPQNLTSLNERGLTNHEKRNSVLNAPTLINPAALKLVGEILQKRISLADEKNPDMALSIMPFETAFAAAVESHLLNSLNNQL